MLTIFFYLAIIMFVGTVLFYLTSPLWKIILLGGFGLIWFLWGATLAVPIGAVLSIFIYLKSKMPTLSKF